jgi:hypothetical protein
LKTGRSFDRRIEWITCILIDSLRILQKTVSAVAIPSRLPHWTEHSSLFNLGVRIHTKSSLFDESIPRWGLLLPKTHLDIAEVTSRVVTISRHEAKKTSTLLRQFSRTVLS